MKVFVTGGAGFIGWHLSRQLVKGGHLVTAYDILDKRAVNPDLGNLSDMRGFRLHRGDICDMDYLARSMAGHDLVIHAAAQTVVDRSIVKPRETFLTNAFGTASVLEAARHANINRFHYVSTDEVSSSIDATFTGRPRNPYSAGKAAGEAAAFAWMNTYGLQVTITNGANTYGPRQSPALFIPRMIVRARLGESLPIYGDGMQSRDWLFVEDHCAGIIRAVFDGTPGHAYSIGSANLIENIWVARRILRELGLSDDRLQYVEDRPGHDRAYQIDTDKIRALGWRQKTPLEEGLPMTVRWYLTNESWWQWFQSEVRMGDKTSP
jgi:dTDP-glucose 4,6-dehydratase